MEKLGTTGNGAFEVYKTNKGNLVGASFVDGRNSTIKENKDGTYDVNVVKNGKTEYNEKLSEDELVKNFAVDINKLDITLDGTNSAKQAQNKYGQNVAKNFYSVA